MMRLLGLSVARHVIEHSRAQDGKTVLIKRVASLNFFADCTLRRSVQFLSLSATLATGLTGHCTEHKEIPVERPVLVSPALEDSPWPHSVSCLP